MGWGTTYDNVPTVELNPSPRITNVTTQNNQFVFTFTGTSNETVVVQASTNLDAGNWQPIKTNVLTTTSTNFIDPQWRDYPDRYYRLSLP